MFNKLEKAKQRYEFLTEEIAKPEVIANNNEWKKLVKEHSGLSPVVEKYEEWRKNNEALTDSLALSDAETDEEMLGVFPGGEKWGGAAYDQLLFAIVAHGKEKEKRQKRVWDL